MKHALATFLFVVSCVAAARQSAAIESVTAPPLPTATVQLQWRGSTNKEVVAYNLCLGTQTHDYDICIRGITGTNCTVSNLVYATKYYFAVCAVDDQNAGSDFSAELIYRPPACFRLPVGTLQDSPDLRAWFQCLDCDVIATNANHTLDFLVPVNEAIRARFFRTVN